MRHSGKVGVVTGAAQGIGLACASLLHKEGASVVLSDVNDAQLDKALALFSGKTSAAKFHCDVSKKAEVRALVEFAVKTFGTVDIFINNAAASVGSEVLDLTEEEFDRVIGVNLKGTLFGCQEAARVMVAKGSGAIVNMSSVQALLAIPNRVPYGISKAGINQLTKIFALSLATKGVRVNAIGPGTILTDLTRGLLDNKEALDRVMSRTPMQRMGTAEEVASIASFLASDEASYLTGQVLYPDGGRLALNYTAPVQPR
jgi:glucose 1-dehydrogenase